MAKRDVEKPWKQRFEIRQKVDSGLYYVVDKADDRFVKNGAMYYYKNEASSAAANYYRAEQRAIEKLLFGQNENKSS